MNFKAVIIFIVVFYIGSLLFGGVYLSSVNSDILYVFVITLSFIIVGALFGLIYLLSHILSKYGIFDGILYKITGNNIFKN